MIWCQVITAIILMAMVRGYNYCNNRTHKCVLDDKEHFMCRLHSFHPLGGSTKYHAIVPDLPEMQNEILSILNKFRNAFASGDFTTKDNKTFASAKRMRKIMWDKELAYMARTHASTVSFQHSECRSTLRFPYVGECLAMMTPKKKPRIRDSFKKMFKMMFEEYLEVEDPDGLLKGFDPIRDYKWAHFTNIISDRVSRVGCGLAVGSNCHQGSSVNYCHFLTCHFDFVNLNGSYVYKAGEPASACDDWNTTGSTQYANLCRNKGFIFPPNQGDIPT